MALFDNIYKLALKAQKFDVGSMIESEKFSSYNYFNGKHGVSAPPLSEDYQVLYKVVATVYACVRTISTKTAQLGIDIVKEHKNADGTVDSINLSDKPEYSVFKQYNEFQTKYDFWEQFFGFLEICGEVPILLDAAKMDSMFVFSPSFLEVVAVNDFIIDHYIFKRNGSEIHIPEENILLVKYFNPDNPLRGLSPISAATGEIALDLQTLNSSKKIQEKGAKPSGLISTDKEINPNEWRKWQKIFDKKHAGSDNAGKIMYLGNGFKWQQMSLSNKDMQIIEQRGFTNKSILKVYGVPPMFTMEFDNSSVLQNTDAQFTMLWETLVPKLTKVEEIFTNFVLPRITSDKDVKFKFNYSKVKELQKNKKEIIEVMEKGFKIGSYSPNDVREALGDQRKDGIPEMDMYFLPLNVAPVSDKSNNEETESEKHLKSASDILYNLKTTDEKIGDIFKGLDDLASNRIKSEYKLSVIGNFNIVNGLFNKVEPKMRKVVKSLFKAQEQEVLANLGNDKGLLEILAKIAHMAIETANNTNHKVDFIDIIQKDFINDDDFNSEINEYLKENEGYYYHLMNQNIVKWSISGAQFNFNEWVKKFSDGGEPYISEAVLLAGESMAESLDWTFDAEGYLVTSKIGTRVANYANIVNQTTKNAIDRILIDAAKNNLSVGEARDLISTYYDKAYKYRALTVARTEMMGGINFGRMEGMRQTPSVVEHTWITQRDGNVREGHMYLDGISVKIGTEFPVDADYAGDPTYPSDINERCSTMPFMKKE